MRSLLLLFVTFKILHAYDSVYNEADSKNVLFFALAAGATNPDTCIANNFVNVNMERTFVADCSDLLFYGQCRATVIVGTSTIGGIVQIGFDTSQDIEKFKTNAPTALSAMTRTPFETYGTVGSDYAKAFDRLWNGAGLGNHMQELWAQYCDFPIAIAGHSIGGCLAQMLAVISSKKKLWTYSKIYMYTHGTPRCGDQDFAASVDASSFTRFRIIWFGDAIPQYPPTTCDRTVDAKLNSGTDCWFHSGHPYYLKSKPFLIFYSWTTCEQCVNNQRIPSAMPRAE